MTSAPASGTVFQKGTTTVTVTATDTAGNSSNCMFTVTVVDNQPPVIACPANITRNTDPDVCSAVVTYPNVTAMDNCDGGLMATCSPGSGTVFPKGATVVTCTVSDAAGHASSCSFTVVVEDHQPPAIACPMVPSVMANLGSTSAPVIYAAPGAGDNCAIASVVCSPASGSSFALGTTMVSCVATDTSGNASACSFPVTVLSPQQSSNLLIGVIQALVNQGVLNQGQGNSLIVKVQGAIQKMDEGNNNAARNQLQAFINDVNAMMNSGKLTAAQGQSLIDAANNLIAHIP